MKTSKVLQNIKSNFKDKVKTIKSDFNNLLNARGCGKNGLSDTEEDNLLPSAVAKGSQLLMSQRSVVSSIENGKENSNINSNLTSRKQSSNHTATFIRKD